MKSTFLSLFNLSSTRFTDAEKNVLVHIKQNQPCTLDSILQCGHRRTSVLKILDRIKWIKRGADQSKRKNLQETLYWIDKSAAPAPSPTKRRPPQQKSLTPMIELGASKTAQDQSNAYTKSLIHADGNADRLTKTQARVLNFVESNQPCTLQDVVKSGVNRKTASNALSELKFIKRAPGLAVMGVRCHLYWLDDRFAPKEVISEAAAARRKYQKELNTIYQHPIISAMYGMSVAECRARF